MGKQYFQPEWLESFLAVTESGSFSAAAARLHSSQPRVSTHVAQLEAAVDRRLFDRSRRPIVLTEAGVVMASHARQVLRSLDEAADAFAGPGTSLRGTVIVGTHPSISGVYMPGLLARTAREEPDVTIELTERTSAPLVTGLVGRSLDLSVQALSSATEHPSIAAIPLWRERYMAVLPAGVGFDGPPERAMTPAELSDLDHIVIARPGNQIESEFAAALSRWGVTPRVKACTEQPNTLLNLVRLGMGVGIINELALKAFGNDDLVVRPIAGGTDGGRWRWSGTLRFR